MKRQATLALLITIVAIGVVTIPLVQNAQAQNLIPSWIKNNAGFWADGDIDDATFLNGIEFL